MSEVAKIELVLTKNGKPVKNACRVSPKIKYTSFMEKLKSYTTKEFKLEYFTSGKVWQALTEELFRPLLKNYKGEPINIVTDLAQQEQSVDNSLLSIQSTRRSEGSLSQSSFSLGRREEEPPPQLPQPQLPSATEPHASIDFQSDQQQDISGDLLTTLMTASEFIPSLAPQQNQQGPNNDFADTVRDIIHFIADYITRELQHKYKILREKEQAIDLSKTCQECKTSNFRGPYFVCLVCPGEYVLCANCEADDSLPDKVLNTHKQKSHPFAKIKRLAQTIKTKEVTTISERDIGFELPRDRPIRVAQPERQESEQEIYNQLIKHFENLYEELLKRSQYHRKVLENPELIHRLKRNLLHRDNLISDAQPQSNGSGTINSSQSTFMAGTNNTSLQSQNLPNEFGLLTETEKLKKLKKLKRMSIQEDVIKKYTSREFENAGYKQVVELIKIELAKGSSS